MGPDASHRPASPPPKVDGFQLEQLLYFGRASAVWRGLDETGEPVVLKVHTDPLPTERDLASRRRAYALGQRLGGPHVVKHLALVTHGRGLALVTEDIGGRSLDLRVQQGPLGVLEALEIAEQVVVGLQHLESHGVVHKDLKPANIIRNPTTGQVKLIDLGSASPLAVERTGGAEYLSGTLFYIAPEQTGRMNRAVDARSDLYATGITLYELLCGHPPFRDLDARRLIHAHLAQDPRPLREQAHHVPPTVCDLVHRLLKKDPNDRYQSATGLLWDLRQCLEGLRARAPLSFPLAQRDVSTRFRLPDTLYGRDEERARLLSAFEQAVRGEVDALLFSGPPGIGKSALLGEIQHPIAERSGWFVSGKFDQFRHDLPYQGWIGVGQDLVRQLLAEPEERLDPLKAALAETLGPHCALLTDVVPDLEALLGHHPRLPDLGPSETQARFNQAFRTFIQLIASSEHPLVVFLDDLQWADLASLRLLEVLRTDRDGGHLLLLGAFRSREVGPTHPLRTILASLHEANHDVTQVELGPIAVQDVQSLLEDATGRPSEDLSPLAQRVHAKTRGNPFFVRQFLERLHQKGLLNFDASTSQWVWDNAQIQSEGITENVADLMSTRIQELEPETRTLLELAACVGASFDLTTLATIQEQDRAQVAADLAPALTQGLLLPLDDDYKYAVHASEEGTLNPRYRFLHDRVQQAAHEGIAAARRAALHHTIGRRIWLATAPEDLDERAVDIADHLALAVHAVEPEQQRDAAALFLRAAQRAKASMATQAARRYLEHGLTLASPDSELALALHTEAADVAYIEGRFEEVTPHADAALRLAKDALSRVPIHNIRIGMGVARHDYVAATHVAIDVLQSDLDVHLPRSPTLAHIGLGLISTRWRLTGRPTEALLGLPEMTEPRALAAMNLMMKTATNAYWGVPDLVPLIAFKMVELSLRHGNTSLSAYGYALYGMILSAALGSVETGYAFGQLSMDLLERTGATHLRGKTGLLFHGYIRHTRDPIRVCATELRRHYHFAMEAGDVENAAYCGTVAYFADVLAGEPLDTLEKRNGRYIESLLESGQEQAIYALKVWLQAVENVSSEDPTSVLVGDHIDFPTLLESLEADGLDMVIAQGVCAAGWLAYLTGDTAGAEAMWGKLVSREDKAPGQIYVKPCLANYAILLERRRSTLTFAERRTLWVLAKRVRIWAKHNPADFAAYAALLTAEEAIHKGRPHTTEAGFTLALEKAHAAQNLWLEALIAERAGQWHNTCEHPQLARRMLDQSANAWRAYGIKDRVGLHSFKSGDITLGTLEEVALSQLDMDAMLEAVQVVSSEIEVDALAAKVIEIAAVIAGARRGVLFLLEDEAKVPYARAAVGPTGELVVSGGREQHAIAAETVLDYVTRTRAPLVVDDVREHAVFSRDPGLSRRGARSVICVPLTRQGRLLGLLSLENDKGVGVFTQVHAGLIEAIAGQAAVSLENARLFEREREQAEVFSRFVPRPFLENLGYRRIEDARLGDGIGRQMSILFSDLRGFTAISEQMTPEENFTFINHYLARMTPAIEENGGFVDAFVGDAVMALFVADSDGAVRAGVGMHRALQEYNLERAQRGRTPLSMGVGIHTGDVLLGIIGSPTRMQANVKGDAVNTASRLEGLTKHYSTPMLISEQTRALMRQPEAFQMRPVGRVQVKGRREPVAVHEVLDALPPERRDRLSAITPLFREALDCYLKRDFTVAAQGFEQCLAHVPDDAISQRFHGEAVALAAKGVNNDWLGVDVRTVK